MKVGVIFIVLFSVALFGCESLGNAIVIETPNSEKTQPTQEQETHIIEQVAPKNDQESESETNHEELTSSDDNVENAIEEKEEALEQQEEEFEETSEPENTEDTPTALEEQVEEQTGVDLVINDVETQHILSYFGDDGEAYRVQLLVSLENKGELASPPSLLHISIANNEYSYTKSLNSGGLLAANTNELRVDFPAIWKGTYDLVITADAEEEIDEDNDTNNVYTSTISLS